MNGVNVKEIYSLARHGLRIAKGKSKPLVWDLNVAAVNRCNQNCPMCNASILTQRETQMMTAASFRKYADMVEDLKIPVCTISGGEPTIVPEMPEILDEAAKRFPVKVMMISNLYARSTIIERVMKRALLNNVHIVCSFDGFGEVADKLRGAPDVGRRVSENIELVSNLKAETGSKSTLEIHTVISDENLDQIDEILGLSDKFGWIQTVAPKNSPAQSPRPIHGVGLTNSKKLENTISDLLSRPNVRQLHSYIKGIPDYAKGTHTKSCPYLTPGIRNLKIFLEPNGDISMCDRTPIGNLNQTSLSDILDGDAHSKFVQRAEACAGCWLSCFTEPALVVGKGRIIDALQHRGPLGGRSYQ